MSGGPIMIMAGGTGGHVFPGLAVAAALRARDRNVVWLGTQRGLEARVVPPAGIDVEWISIAGVRGKGALALLAAPFRIARALAQALGALRRRRPAAVLGMGGFVAGPGGFAAWLTRRPLLLHEQNAVAGTTNRLLAPLATRIFAAFPGSFPGRHDDEVIGNPVRATIAAGDSPRERLLARRAERRRLLVVGGSLGARILNETLPRALAAIAGGAPARGLAPGGAHRNRRRAQGVRRGATSRRASSRSSTTSRALTAGRTSSSRARAASRSRSSRSSASARSSCRSAPRSTITRRATREHFTRAGAGLLIAEQDLTPSALADALTSCLGDFDRLVAMAEAARAQAHADAAEKLAAACVTAAEDAAMNDRMGSIRTIHFVGIGGAGMAGIAEVLLNLGYSVQRLGFEAHVGHRAAARARRAGAARATRPRTSARPTSSSCRARSRPTTPRCSPRTRAAFRSCAAPRCSRSSCASATASRSRARTARRRRRA